MKCRNFGNKMIIVADSSRDRRSRSRLTVDELIELGHSNFEKLMAKPEPAVYVYKFADLPEVLTCAEIRERNRRRWDQFGDVR